MSEPGITLTRAGEQVTARLGELGAAMRAQGSRVGVGELLAATRCLEAINPASREDARLALRTVLCSQKTDLERFELAFASVFGEEWVPINDPLAELGDIVKEALPSVGMPDPSGVAPAPDSTPVPAAWSDVELLREKDFAHYTLGEAIAARQLIAQLARRHPVRLSRRTRASRRRAHAPDLRATVRESLRTGGEPLHRRWRTRTTRPRPVVLVCDVSGSMTPYARMLCSTCTPAWPRAGGWRRSPSARG